MSSALCEREGCVGRCRVVELSALILLGLIAMQGYIIDDCG